MSIATGTSLWTAYVRPSPGARLRLFCFPYAGGGAAAYRPWLETLPAAVQVVPVQLPGRENRIVEAPFTRITPLVEKLGEALYPELDLPFAFFGHSMGALVSFELARYLRNRYQVSPAHLFVSAHRAPALPDPIPPIHALPEVEFIRELRELNGTPEQVLQHAEIMQLMLPVLRADFELCETYAYAAGQPLECDISAWGGLQDPKTSRAELEHWREQTRGTFKMRMFPGDHFYLLTGQSLVRQALSLELAQVLSRI